MTKKEKISTPEEVRNLWDDDIKKTMEGWEKDFDREIWNGGFSTNERENNQGQH